MRDIWQGGDDVYVGIEGIWGTLFGSTKQASIRHPLWVSLSLPLTSHLTPRSEPYCLCPPPWPNQAAPQWAAASLTSRRCDNIEASEIPAVFCFLSLTTSSLSEELRRYTASRFAKFTVEVEIKNGGKRAGTAGTFVHKEVVSETGKALIG